MVSQTARVRKGRGSPPNLGPIFQELLERHVPKLRVRWPRATGPCPFHQERTPSFSADIEKGVWHCFGCGASGGVKAFTLRVSEPWGATRSESRTAKAHRARIQAERQARTILARRAEEQDRQLCAEHRELYGAALAAADLLRLFHRRPDLAREFADLIAQTERAYGEALFRCTVLEAQLNWEVAA